MAVSIESFLVLETALATRLTNAWIRDTASTQRKIIDAVNAGDFATAVDLCDDLGLGPSAQRQRGYAEFVGMQAVLYGASRLTRGNPKRTGFAGKSKPEEVEQAVDILMQTLTFSASESVCRLANDMLLRERADQQDEAFKSERRRKASTTGFIRGFQSSVGANGKSFINIGSSLHNSRLGAWGFTQEANFRGISEYQVSEQLDSRTCPVCQAMNGRKFSVAPAQKKLETWLNTKNAGELKSLAPWPSQSKANVSKMRGMSNDQLAANGWDTPPYHPLCRGVLVPSGTLRVTKPIQTTRPVEAPEETVQTPLPEAPAPAQVATADPHDLPFTGSATEYRDRFFVPNVTSDDVLARHKPSAATTIEKYERDLAKRTSTKDLHHDGENWSPERQRLHEQIIGDVLNPEAVARATAAPGTQPSVTVLGGRGGSGKTFLTEGVDEAYFKRNGVGKGAPVDISDKIVLNSDEIKKLLPEYEGWNAGQLHAEGSELLKRIEKIARQRNLNVVLDTTLAGVDKAVANVQRYISAGYQAEGYYMHLPRQEAAFRAVFRGISGEKRYVPTDIILTNLDNEEAFDALTQFFSRWGIWDNQVELGDLPRFVGGQNLRSTVEIVGAPAGG